MPIFRRGTDPNALVIAMTGVQMGDRLLQIGCSDRTLLGAMAAKVGLSGSAAVVVFAADQTARARKAAAHAGVLADVHAAQPQSLPFEEGSFDLIVVDSTAGLLAGMRPEDRVHCLQEAFRVLRPGGRIVVVETSERGGLASILSRGSADATHVASGGMVPSLKAEGFTSARVLAEREGRTFTEGIKPRPNL